MKLQLGKMDEDTWITAQGKYVKVEDMNINHLVNTVNFLRRNELQIRLGILSSMWEYIETAPEGAAMACELESKAIEKMTVDEFLTLAVKPYKRMLERYAKTLD